MRWTEENGNSPREDAITGDIRKSAIAFAPLHAIDDKHSVAMKERAHGMRSKNLNSP